MIAVKIYFLLPRCIKGKKKGREEAGVVYCVPDPCISSFSLCGLDSKIVSYTLLFPETSHMFISVAYVIAMLIDNIIDLYIIKSSIFEK